MKLFDKILVPTDFSPHAAQANRVATELARIHGASLCLVHVYDVIPYVLPEGMPLYDATQVAQVREHLLDQLANGKRAAQDAGIKEVETLLLQGSAHAEIVEAAKARDFGLIVMGTHGRSGFAHMLLGSVAEKVVRKAPCPVLTVPFKEAQS